MAASANPLLQEAEERDPMLVATGAGKVRFYMFTNDEEVSKAERDVQNEKPRLLAGGSGRAVEAKAAEVGSAAILHTTMGDIHLRLFPEAAPKSVENFVGLARSGYYNGTVFHRVIRKFMIQVWLACFELGCALHSSFSYHFSSPAADTSFLIGRRSAWRRHWRHQHLGPRVRGRVLDAQA